MIYDLEDLQAPRATGALLRAFVALVESPITSGLLSGMLLRDAGIVAMRDVASEDVLPVAPPGIPDHRAVASGIQGTPPLLRELLRPVRGSDDFHFEGVGDFEQAYRSGAASPVEVAERVITAIEAGEARTPKMRAFIATDAADLRRQAKQSGERWASGASLGPLDGVPVAVKDELDQLPFGTTVGTAFLGKKAASEDATVVKRLRDAGALLIGKANMHEIGMGVTGLNPVHGACRNPYDPARATGGSSSGPGAAVAAGLCPIAVGADGGGSIRIPASLCGIVGLKATYGRISEHGAAPLCWSVAHVGPMAASARDCALGYALMGGADPQDPNTLGQPALHLDRFLDDDLSGLKIGLFRPWFEHADAEVVLACTLVLDMLKDSGAEVVEVTIPELNLLRTVHLVTIITEMATSHIKLYEQHRADYGLDTRLNLALARALRAYDYVHAQRHRARLCAHFGEVLHEVDVLVTPSTGCTAPILAADALKAGESNLPLTDRIMRFAPAGNLTGLPAISFPAGYDAQGLPIGLQVMGRPWEEHLLLRMARVVEDRIPRRAPQVHSRLLGG